MSSKVKNVLRALGFILSALCLMNVYGDFSEVEAKAGVAASPDGAATMIQANRGPFSHSYTFVVNDSPDVVVKCARQFIFVGTYGCEKE